MMMVEPRASSSCYDEYVAVAVDELMARGGSSWLTREDSDGCDGSDDCSNSPLHDDELDSATTSTTSSSSSASSSNNTRSRPHGDPDRRARRAIANSNERRRMQSINAGFQSLHELLVKQPRHGHVAPEKLSKAAILQRAVDYIDDLHRQKQQLVARNARLMQLLATGTGNSSGPDMTSWPAKRRRLESLSSCSLSSDDTDTPTSGPRRKPEVDGEEAEVGAEDLRIASLPLTTATLPVAAQVTIAQPSVRDAASIRSLLEQSTDDDDVDDLSVHERRRSSWTCSTSSSTLPSVCSPSSSTSRRNLETILEAIHHLEAEADDVRTSQTSSLSSLTEALMSSPSPPRTSSTSSPRTVPFTTTNNNCVAVRSS